MLYKTFSSKNISIQDKKTNYFLLKFRIQHQEQTIRDSPYLTMTIIESIESAALNQRIKAAWNIVSEVKDTILIRGAGF